MRAPTTLRNQFFVFATPSLFALCIVLLLVYFIQRDVLYNSEWQKNQIIANTSTELIASQLNDAREDLDFISVLSSSQQAEQNNSQLTSSTYLASLFKTKPHYSKLLMLDKKGSVTDYFGSDFSLETISRELPSLDYGFAPLFENNLNGTSLSGIQIIKRQYHESEATVIGFLILEISLTQLKKRLINPELLNGSSIFIGFNHQFTPIFIGDTAVTDAILNTASFNKKTNQNLITSIQSMSDYIDATQGSWINQWAVLTIGSTTTLENGKTKIIATLTVLTLLLSIIFSIVSLYLAKSRLRRFMTRHDLAESERLNKSIVETTTNAIVTLDNNGNIISSNPAAQHLFSRASKSIVGGKFGNTFIVSSEHKEFQIFFKQILAKPPGSHSELRDFTAFDVSGEQLPVSIALAVDEHHGQRIINSFITDNTEHHKNIELQRLTEVVFQAASEGITITDANNNIIAINPAFCHITGFTEEEVIGKNPRMLRSGKHNQNFYEDLWEELLYKGIWKGEIWNRKKTGDIYPEEISIALVRNERGQIQHHISIFHDISQRKEREERIAYQAHYDQLTGLPNRFVFIDNLDREINSFHRYGDSFALLFIDLDHFKEINDQHGHRTGDLVLQETARRLTNSVRDSDMVARLAGDEFTLIIRALDSEDDLGRLIAKVEASLNGQFNIGNQNIDIKGSIGGVIYSEEHGTADDLLQLADESMYTAKRKILV